MRLSIVNYGLDPGAEVPKYAKKEDDELIAIATEIIKKHDFGPGAVVVSEVFHTGLKNSNHRKYMEKGMDKAVMSFFQPHLTPFLMHHEMGGGSLFSSGDSTLLSVGSNIFSRYSRRATETPSGLSTGYGKVATFIPNDAMIGGQNAIDALRSRRLLTVSLGARVADNDYRCSICGKSMYDEECGHTPGKDYDGAICMAEVYNPLFREYSVVYNPSDIYAAVRRMDVMEGEGAPDKYQVIDQEPSLGYLHVYEEVGKSVHPSASIKPEGGDTMGDNAQASTPPASAPAPTQSTEQSIGQVIALYEAKLKEKDDVIVSLATALRDRIDELDKLKSDLSLGNIQPQEGDDEQGKGPGETPPDSALPGGDTDPDTNTGDPDGGTSDPAASPDGAGEVSPPAAPAGDGSAGEAGASADDSGKTNDQPSGTPADGGSDTSGKSGDDGSKTDPPKDSDGSSEPGSSAKDANKPEGQTVIREALGSRLRNGMPPKMSGNPLGGRSIASAIRRNH